MNIKKHIKFIIMGSISIICLIALIILFSTLFDIKTQNFKTQDIAKLDALEEAEIEKTETVGTPCTGKLRVDASRANVSDQYIPKGYYCCEKDALVNFEEYFSANDFQEYFKNSPIYSLTEKFSEGYDTSKKGQEGGKHITTAASESLRANGYEFFIEGADSGTCVRSRTYWECEGEDKHTALSPAAAFAVTDPNATTKEIQSAIWANKDENTGTFIPDSGQLTLRSQNYAAYYAAYEEKVKSR